MTEATLHPHARAYAKKGWRVMPLHWPTGAACSCSRGDGCKSAGKHPLVDNWTEQATTELMQVDIWWNKWPEANIGIATGKASGIIVLDIDGVAGMAALQGLFLEHKKPDPTPTSVTGSGGRHIVWRHPGTVVSNKVRILPGIDIRGDGGLIVAPPSMHLCGKRYKWHDKAHPARVQIQEAPGWILKMLAPKRRPMTGRVKSDAFELDRIQPIPEGGRNDRLFRIMCRLVKEVDHSTALRHAHEINQSKCNPPLPDFEVEQIVAGAVRRYG